MCKFKHKWLKKVSAAKQHNLKTSFFWGNEHIAVKPRHPKVVHQQQPVWLVKNARDTFDLTRRRLKFTETADAFVLSTARPRKHYLKKAERGKPVQASGHAITEKKNRSHGTDALLWRWSFDHSRWPCGGKFLIGQIPARVGAVAVIS